MRVIVFTPSVPWHQMVQRPQQIAYQFAMKGWKVYYMSRPDAIKPGGLERPMNLILWGESIQSIKEKVDVVYSISPAMYRYKNRMGEKLFVYDCADDFSQYWGQREVFMTEYADVIITSAQTLYDKKVKLKGDSTYLVRNGVNLDTFKPGDYEKPLDMKIDKLVIGYVGAMSYWLDWKLIEHLSKAMPEYNFVYIGPPFGTRLEVEMKNRRNMRFLRHKDVRKLPYYIKYFNVCLVPFLKNAITASADPVKVYEYLAMGKPVVSTRLPELEKHKESELVHLADNYDDFVILLKRAIEEDSDEQREQRIEVVKQHSWSERVDRIIEAFEIEFQKPKKTIRIVPVPQIKPSVPARIKKIITRPADPKIVKEGEKFVVKVNSTFSCSIGRESHSFKKNGTYTVSGAVYDILSVAKKLK